MQIEDLLSMQQRHAPNLPVDAELDQALKLMHQSGAPAVIIMENDRICGILTRSDILRCLAQEAWDLAMTVAVKEVMSCRPVVASPTELVSIALERMQACDIAHLPVIDNGRLAGMLSIDELLSAEVGRYREEIAQLQEYIDTLQNAEFD